MEGGRVCKVEGKWETGKEGPEIKQKKRRELQKQQCEEKRKKKQTPNNEGGSEKTAMLNDNV